MQTTLTPMPFQEEGIGCIERFGGRALLADDTGLGKTLQALWALRRNTAWLPAVVVCPVSVKVHWSYVATQLGFRTEVLDGTRPFMDVLRRGVDLFVINYDILYRWVPWLRQRGIRTVVIDECQNIQTRDTRRTVAARELCNGLPFVIALSGTPLMNRPWDLFPTLNIIRPDIYNSAWSFGVEYCQPRRERGQWVFKGASKVPELHARLRKDLMIRRLKADVLKDLPPKMRCIVPIEIRNAEEYGRASRDFMGWLRGMSPAKARRAAKAQAVTRMTYLLELAGRGKVRGTVRWVDHFLEETEHTNAKIVLFAFHKAMVATLGRRYNGRSVCVTGDITGRARWAAVQQFKEDPSVRLFIGNGAATAGIDGLQVSQDIGFTQFFWRPADHTQAEGRLERIGQGGTHIRSTYLVAAGTIEEDMCDIIQTKQDVIRGVLDGDVENAETLPLFDLLLERMLQRK